MAAGLGLKTFVTGDVLTAADTNGYLMQGVWVFADAAARTAAVTSPQEGNMSYLKDTNSTEYYDGAAWVAVAGTSKVVQVVNTQTGTAATGTTVMPNDGTIPQNTEGTQFMTLSITPTNSSNKLFIEIVTRQQVTGSNKDMIIALFQDSTAGALAANNYRQTGDTVAQLGVLNYYMTAGTTSSTEFKVRIGSADAGTVTFCPNNMGQIASSSITITEIAA